MFSCNGFRNIQNKPQVPDFSVLMADFPEFIDSAYIDTIQQKSLADYSNFLLARKKLIFWRQKIFYDNYLVFKLLENINNLELSYWGNNSWHSTKQFFIDSDKYDVEVFGTINSSENVYWELFVTINDTKQYKFIEGNIYSNSQSWQIYKHQIITYKTVKIEIDQTSSDNQTKEFYLLDENSDFYRSSLRWDKENTMIKTRISNSVSKDTFNIYFDTVNFYGGICDTVCNCWNDQLLNSDTCYDCPF